MTKRAKIKNDRQKAAREMESEVSKAVRSENTEGLEWGALEDSAKVAFDAEDLTRARELLEKATKDPLCGPSVWVNLGLVDLDLGRFEDAIFALSCAEAAGEDVFVNRGLAHERRGDAVAARGDYSKAVAMDPSDVDALVNLGTLDLAEGNLDAARHLLEHAAALDPTANWALVDVYREIDDLDRAATAPREAIKAGEHRAYLDLGEVLREDGDVSGSNAAYEDAISHGVANAEERYAEVLADPS